MSEFNLYSPYVMAAAMLSGLIVCLLQTDAVVLESRRMPKEKIMTTLREAGYFVICFNSMYLVWQTAWFANTGYPVALTDVYGRYCFLFTLVLTVFSAPKTDGRLLTVSGLVLLCAMPEGRFGVARTFLLYGLLAVRRHIYGIQYRRNALDELSRVSVKDAMNSLNSGLLFYDLDGSRRLINRKMYELMEDIFHTSFRNANLFYDCLVREGKNSPEPILTASDGRIWLFSRHEITIGRRKYYELTASDVTEKVKANRALIRTRENLERSREALREALETAVEQSRQEAMLEVRGRTHDLFGSRLSLLLQSLRYEGKTDVDVLVRSCRDLMKDITEIDGKMDAEAELQSLKATMGRLGIRVAYNGSLPEDEADADVLVQAVREAITNSVRHAYATQITVDAGMIDHAFTAVIKDNGTGSPDCHEGGGLRAMRRRIEARGGTLEVCSTDPFVLKITFQEEQT
ncbi:MAG: hypothetical protein IKD69_13170 [Solobacterium sp.]|nr:hypothetical protein [Solobacterium sp.]